MEKKIIVENPATNGVACEVESMSVEKIRSAVERAGKVQSKWKYTPVRERVSLVERFIVFLFAERKRIAEEITGRWGNLCGRRIGKWKVARKGRCIWLLSQRTP